MLRRWLPWLVGASILAVVALRIPAAEFRDALGQGRHLWVALVDICWIALLLGTDAVATRIGLGAAGTPRPLGEIAAARGASYLLVLVNYAAGQGAFGYYLHRSGVSGARAAGLTLFLVGTNLAALWIVTTVAWFALPHAGHGSLGVILVAGCVIFAGYLLVVGSAPEVLVTRPLLAPLFEAGLRGHAVALAARLPHAVGMALGYWLAIRAWGLDVPWTAGMALMPVVVIATVLPIAPAGLGTSQAALVLLFASYSTAATAAQRSAEVFAFSVAHTVYGIIGSALVGLVCLPFARRLGGKPEA